MREKLLYEPNEALNGGGVANYGALEMSSGSISNNTAGHNGGGINNAGTLTMTGGSIEYNTATSDGGGVYQNGIFNMGDGATVNLGNDVYLASGKTITVTSGLTGSLVANIKLSSYGVGTQLLEADSGVNLAAAAGKFMVNMDIATGDSAYFVDSSGRLQNN